MDKKKVLCSSKWIYGCETVALSTVHPNIEITYLTRINTRRKVSDVFRIDGLIDLELQPSIST
jgi:hypothetical protein